MADLDYGILFGLILTFSAFGFISAAAAEDYPQVESFTGVTPPSDIDACDFGSVQDELLYFRGMELGWPAFGTDISNVVRSDTNLKLDTGATTGYYEIAELAPGTDIAYDKARLNASIPQDASITLVLWTETDQKEVQVNDGYQNYTIDPALQQPGDSQLNVRIEMDRATTNVSSPVFRSIELFGDRDERSAGVFQAGECGVAQITNMFSWVVHVSENTWIRVLMAPLQIMFILLLLAAIVNIISVVPFLGG